MLHIIAKSPVEPVILDRIGAGDTVLFIRSAVLAVLSGNILREQLKLMLIQNQLFALSPDLAARGILPEELLDDIRVIDYAGFVELTIEHPVIQSWG
jgi:sulfur relay protein TusB/DsrH